MRLVYILMQDKKCLLSTLSTIWEETDGCAKQYHCALALYLLSMVASRFGIIIDTSRAIGASGHGRMWWMV